MGQWCDRDGELGLCCTQVSFSAVKVNFAPPRAPVTLDWARTGQGENRQNQRGGGGMR